MCMGVIKDNVVKILGFVVFVAIAAYFFNPTVMYQTNDYIDHLKSAFTNKITEVKEAMPSETIKKDNCEKNAMKLIPKNITLCINNGGGVWSFGQCWTINKTKWNDGGEIINYLYAMFKYGNSAGQNVNLLYPSQIPNSGGYELAYSRQIISSEGAIKGNNEFKVEFSVLKPIESTLQEYYYASPFKEPWYQSMSFQVLNLTILSCSWVEE